MDTPAIYLAFEPLNNEEGQIEQLKIILINNTDGIFSFGYEFFMNGDSVAKIEGKLSEKKFCVFNEISAEQLNDFPEAVLDFNNEKNEPAKEKHLKKILKIKAQTFFNKLQPSPLINKDTYLFYLFTEFPGKMIDRIVHDHNFNVSFRKTKNETAHDVVTQANWQMEIDLHIEHLVSTHRGMSNAEIIKIQLNRFQQFLEKSIGRNIPKIYVIHGVGKGKLRDEIHRILGAYPEVQSFNNDYHHKYGFGATEIVLSVSR